MSALLLLLVVVVVAVSRLHSVECQTFVFGVAGCWQAHSGKGFGAFRGGAVTLLRCK